MAENNKRRRLSVSGSFKMDRSASNANEEVTGTEDRSQTPAKERKSRTLFVRSLPATATTESLTEHFSQSYPLKHATVVLDPQTKESKGYGFVTFTDHQDAELAAKELHNSVLDGKKIKIEIAEPRHREIDEKIGKSVPSSAPSKAKELKDKRKKEALPPKLIIRNLPWSITEPEHLELLFRSYGKIKHAVVPKKGTRVAGFGFVVMRGRKNAERAIEGVNGKEVDGRTLAVDWAVDKDEWDSMNNVAADTSADGMEEGEEKSADDTEEKEHLDIVDDGESDLDAEDGGVELENEDEDDDISMGEADEDEDDVEDEDERDEQDDRNQSTLFIRNLPFSATDESLHEHFKQFGPVRYARVVLDPVTERPKGTAFVCFYKPESAASCIREAPREAFSAHSKDPRQKAATRQMHSVLEDENKDPSGQYTMDGRVLQVSQAVSRTEAGKLEEEGTSRRETRDHDKRRLFLLSEGTIPTNSPEYSKLSETERKMREASAKQRQKLIKSNPMLHVSLTRLSVRNLPRHIDSKALKALAREAVVGFAKDVKNGLRKPISWEESRRSAAQMKEAEHLRKQQKKGIVKQAKVVFEGKDGGKVNDQAGRSRGYGFIEYATHRSSLMGLRWLNGHAIGASATAPNADPADRKKRLIVEFALENAQVVNRRRERESTSRKNGQAFDDENADGAPRGIKRRWDGKEENGAKRERGGKGHKNNFKNGKDFKKKKGTKNDDKPSLKKAPSSAKKADGETANEKDNDFAKRNRIIARKRMLRRNRK